MNEAKYASCKFPINPEIISEVGWIYTENATLYPVICLVFSVSISAHPDIGRCLAFDHHIHASRLARSKGAFQRGRDVLGAGHVFAMAPKRHGHQIIASAGGQFAAMGATGAVIALLDFIFGVSA